VCEGFNERTGQPFPPCASTLLCVDAGAITIPGAGNVCITKYEADRRVAHQKASAEAARQAALKKAEDAAKLAAEEAAKR